MVPVWGEVSMAAPSVSADISVAVLAGVVLAGGVLAGVVMGGRDSVTSVALGGGRASRPLLSAVTENVARAGPDWIGWLLGVFFGPIRGADRVGNTFERKLFCFYFCLNVNLLKKLA